MWDARWQAEEMANPFVKFWKYMMAAFSSKIDEYADPKVQIQQAIEEAQRNHQALTQQAASVNQMSQLAAPGNTPSLEEVREKIEKRYTTALGQAELAQNSVQGRMLEVQASATQMAGQSRLQQIRASMRGDSVAQVTDGGAAATKATSQADIQREIQARVQAEQGKNPA